ncbi:uncharacterized protein [Musca autumnalis]|uniref:uncharacterized protein n=1 Tax=Musca autumnalis TaxID=221902 RepID=UPI003CEF2151
MRFYPTTDINFFYDHLPSWSLYCRTPKKSWKRKIPPPRAMYVYRDLEGAAMARILRKHLFLSSQWPKSRIRYEACLPLYYGVGGRFIRLERAPPLGFKCSPRPINLREAQALLAYEAKLAKMEAKLLKQQEKADGAEANGDSNSKKKGRKK